MSAAATVIPVDTREIQQLVQAANSDRTSVEIVGGGSKRGIGNPARKTELLSTRRLARVIDYDPPELVLTVEAGVPLAEIETMLAAQDQMLAFEPLHFSALQGAASACVSTIGGVVATGFAGSRRLTAGNVRDHLLGFTAVAGSGEIFKAGGRVVKNVTGYDLSKLVAGSWGQLAVLTELTLKVMPRPRSTLTLAITGLDESGAFFALTSAMRSQAMVAAAAYLPADVMHGRSQTLLRLEGFEPSVNARARTLIDVFGGTLSIERLDPITASDIWTRIRDVNFFGDIMSDHALWRICVPTTSGVTVAAGLRKSGGAFVVDWAGGLLWANVPIAASGDAIRKLAEQVGGHATLVRAPISYRSITPALHPEPAGAAALAQRVRLAFDPNAILAAQRFVAAAQ